MCYIYGPNLLLLLVCVSLFFQFRLSVEIFYKKLSVIFTIRMILILKYCKAYLPSPSSTCSFMTRQYDVRGKIASMLLFNKLFHSDEEVKYLKKLVNLKWRNIEIFNKNTSKHTSVRLVLINNYFQLTKHFMLWHHYYYLLINI